MPSATNVPQTPNSGPEDPGVHGLTNRQYWQLLQPIDPGRVLEANGQHHVAGHDVIAHLNRVVGFGGWDKEVMELRVVFEGTVDIPAKNGKPARKDVPALTYLCRLRLTVRNPAGEVIHVSEDVGTGTSPNLPTWGDAHDFASKNSVTYALKRCAKDLGDGFGLSLYDKGSTRPIVGRTAVWTPPDTAPGAPAQESVSAGVTVTDLGEERPVSDEPPPVDPEQAAAWFASWSSRVRAAKTVDALRALYRELGPAVRAGAISDEQTIDGAALVEQCVEEAAKAAAS